MHEVYGSPALQSTASDSHRPRTRTLQMQIHAQDHCSPNDPEKKIVFSDFEKLKNSNLVCDEQETYDYLESSGGTLNVAVWRDGL